MRWHTDGPDPYPGVRLVEERYDWLSALVEGARRYPELGALLPTRSASAVTCKCTGHPAFGPGKVICPDCCGLGWVEANRLSPVDEGKRGTKDCILGLLKGFVSQQREPKK